jgi:hypothetical protein
LLQINVQHSSTVPHQSSDYDVVFSRYCHFQDVRKDYRARIWNADFTYIGRQGYGGEYTRPLYLSAYGQSLPTKHHSVFQRLIHQQLSIKKLWRTHYIAAHDHLTDRLNKYDDWGLSNSQQSCRNRQARTTIWGHVGVPEE